MKKKEDILKVSDEMVVDSIDVERARALSMVRGRTDSRVEHTCELPDGELLTGFPDRDRRDAGGRKR